MVLQMLSCLWNCWTVIFPPYLKLSIFPQRGYFCLWSPGLWTMQKVLPGGGSQRRGHPSSQRCDHCQHQPHRCEWQPPQVQPRCLQCCYKWGCIGRRLCYFGRCQWGVQMYRINNPQQGDKVSKVYLEFSPFRVLLSPGALVRHQSFNFSSLHIRKGLINSFISSCKWPIITFLPRLYVVWENKIGNGVNF